MRFVAKLAVVILGCAIAAPSFAQQITGAGSTFVYPILSKWSEAYNQLKGVRVNYQSIGSGGGIAQIKAGTVDFGASDAPLPPDQLSEAKLAQFPVVIGGVVPVYNIEGIDAGQLRFTGPLLADIYLGKIKRWNDPAIAADWPTPETRAMWLAIIQGFTPRESSTWAARRYWSPVTWAPGAAPVPGMPVRLFHLDGKPVVLSTDGLPIGELNAPLNPYLRGLVRASVMAEPAKISLTYLGPDDLWRV